MSASSWTTCPRCVERHQVAVNAKIQAAANAYGKIPVEEWTDMHEAARAADIPLEAESFREDYEVWGASEGTIYFSYTGSCTECGLGLSFSEERPFFPVRLSEVQAGCSTVGEGAHG